MSDLNQIEKLSRLSVPRYATRLKPTTIPTARWNDEPLYGICINDEWISHLLGVLTALDQPDTWIGTSDEIYDARQQVTEIMVAFMEQCDPMNNCCNDIPLQRIDENGHYQQSDDDGATWHDAPSGDPRNTIPRIPPYPPASSDNAKCLYADSIVQHFKTMFVQVIEEGETVSTILGVLTTAAEIIFGPLTGPIGWIIPALVAIPTAILLVGITDFETAMTDDVWNKLRCLIDCNIGDDGTISQANLDAIYSGIDDVSPDNIVRTVFRSWFAALGTTGMTNAAHLGMGETGADCSDCDCGGCATTWEIYPPNPGLRGEIVERGDDYVIVQSLDPIGSIYYTDIVTPGADQCCYMALREVLEGGSVNPAIVTCGNDPASDPTGGLVGEGCYVRIQENSSGPFKVKYTFSECP